jgi:hypothetical protein
MLGRGEVEGAVMVAESTNILVGFVAGWIEETENVGKTLDSNRVKYISDICVMPGLARRRIVTRHLMAIEQSFLALGITLRMVDAATPSACCPRSEATGDRVSH